MCVCADQDIKPNPLPIEPLIVFPSPTQPTPTPLPQPVPITTTTLNPDELYVVESQIELMLRKYGDGDIKVLETTGPKILPAKYVYGNGAFEVKEFTYPYLYIITANKPGTVAVDFIPSGLEKENEVKITRQILSIPGSPNPPPNPEPEPLPPNPTPEPDDNTVDHIHISMVQDTRNVSQGTATTLNGLYGWEKYITSGNTYLLYDVTTKETGGKQAITDIKAKAIPYPAMTIRDKTTNELLDVVPFPQTVNDLKVCLNSYLKVKI